VESRQKFPDVIHDGEPVIVTEKIHGANARYVCCDDTFFMGSRTQWLKPDVQHPWRCASETDPRIEAWCRTHPGHVLYGEIYGAVQSLKYGCSQGEVRFAAFAVSYGGQWLDTGSILADETLATVPVLYRGPYHAGVLDLAESDSSVPGAGKGHMSEGIVIVPEQERRDDEIGIGRVIVKHVSNRYWESTA
jgi:RNA ligase (TIGR02306 family)